MTDSLNFANKKSTLDYCVSKATPDGSNLYYATLFDNEKNKNIIICFHAFLNELSDIIYECTDPGVARIKFKWWQEEIERLKNLQPRHPVTRQFLNNTSIDISTINSFNNIIESFEQYLFLEQPDSLSTSLSLFKVSYGEVWQQCAKQLGINETASSCTILDMGAIYHFLNCLQQPYIYISESRCIIPSSYMSQAELLQLKFNKSEPNPEHNEIFTQLFTDLIYNLNEIYKNFAKKDYAFFRHGLILNRLALKTAEEMQNNGSSLLTTSMSLTPIRKLWIAWKTNLFI